MPDAEYAEHLRKLADAAFAERAAEQKSLRAVLRADGDVYGIGPLALAQEKARRRPGYGARSARGPQDTRKWKARPQEPYSHRPTTS
ncbi:hypothetical protein [Streptomyces sp. NBC_01244]|uniref:hypothetical protein n=1 Tax=Streptomyces sp. NBC_01244 TaxID=2903797 RepID=UPI002E0E1566|nr:hypothetical protein OG247_44065 [Streptomyces sp. NBC_01244]